MQPAIVGGLFIGILSALPVVSICNCCCVWLVSGGVLAAYLRQQNDPRPLTPGGGAQLGLVAGLVGAVIWLIAAQALDVVVAPIQDRLLGEVLNNARDLPPDARVFLESAMEREGGYLFGFFLMAIVGAPFAALGGLIGAAYFRRDVPPALGGPIVHEPPPPPTPNP